MDLSLARHPEDDPLHSSVKHIEAFEEHPTWRDMLDWFEETKDVFRDDLVKADSIEEIKELQGKIKMLEIVEELPDLFRRQIEADNEIENET